MSATAAQLSEFVVMARRAIQREYPVALVLTLDGAEDLGLPRDLTPAFHASYDWHSAVHGHWSLARAARLHPGAPWAETARQTLARSLTAENLEREHAFVARRAGFERPYGLAWLLQLAAELRMWDHAPASTDRALSRSGSRSTGRATPIGPGLASGWRARASDSIAATRRRLSHTSPPRTISCRRRWPRRT